MSEIKELVAALRNQRQIDRDGSEVAVSRQAVDEAADLLDRHGEFVSSRETFSAAGTLIDEGTKSAEPVKAPSDDVLLDFYHARTKNEIRHPERTILALFKDLLARYGQPAQPAASAEPVGRINYSDYQEWGSGKPNRMAVEETSPGSIQRLPAGTQLYTAPVAAQPSVPDRQALTFDQWWSAGGHKIVSAQANRSGWKGAAGAGYIAGLLSSAAITPLVDGQAQPEANSWDLSHPDKSPHHDGLFTRTCRAFQSTWLAIN